MLSRKIRARERLVPSAVFDQQAWREPPPDEGDWWRRDLGAVTPRETFIDPGYTTRDDVFTGRETGPQNLLLRH